MNLQEFAALKPGDKIENLMTSSRGTVAEATDTGVSIVWGWAETRPVAYSVNSTAWMHWSREAEPVQAPD